MKQTIGEFDDDQDKPEVVQAKYLDNDRYRYLRMPSFRQAALYWAIYYKLKIDEIIKPLLNCENVFPEMPRRSLGLRNCFHACCMVGNFPALLALFDPEILEKRYERISGISKSQVMSAEGAVPPKPPSLSFFSITENEKKTNHYSKKFVSNVKKMQGWMTDFQNQVVKQITTGSDKFKVLHYFEQQDELGNTPLHLSSAHGYVDIVKFLLEKGIGLLK